MTPASSDASPRPIPARSAAAMTASAAARASAASATSTVRQVRPLHPRGEGRRPLPQRDGTYSHRLHGTCHCGQSHGEAAAAPGNARPAAPGVLKRRAEQRFRSFFTLAAYPATPLRRGHDRPPLGLPRRAGARGLPRPARRLPSPRRLEGQELPPLPQGRRRPLAPVAARLAAAALQSPGHPRRAAGRDRRPARRREMHRPRHRPRPAVRHDQRPRRQGPAAHRLDAAGRPHRRHPRRRRRRRHGLRCAKSPPSWPVSIPPLTSTSSPCRASPTARTSSSGSTHRRDAGLSDADLLAELLSLIDAAC